MQSKINPLNKPITSFTYTSCYCEENIYLLVRDHIPPEKLGEYYVVIISNSEKCIPWFYSKSAPLDGPFAWDYHVILLHAPSTASTPSTTPTPRIYDFDTVLTPFGVPFTKYFERTLYGPRPWPPSWSLKHIQIMTSLIVNYPRKFKLVKAGEYLRLFASTREHMIVPPEELEKGKGGWTAEGRYVPPRSWGEEEEEGKAVLYHKPVPEYPPIRTDASTNTLPIFLDFSDAWVDSEYGKILDEKSFLKEFGFCPVLGDGSQGKFDIMDLVDDDYTYDR